MFAVFVSKKTLLNKFEFMESSICFVWNHLKIQTDNFYKLLNNEDWKIAQEGLAKILDVLSEITSSSLQRKTTIHSMYGQEWQEWSISQFRELSVRLFLHDSLINDDEASNNEELKELLALEMSLYWRLIALSKQK